MIPPMLATFIVLALAVAGFMTNRLPLVIVALFVPVALWGTGVLTLNESLQGFSDPITLFIASLFVLSEALDATGITAWIGQQLELRSSLSRTGLLITIMAVAAALSAVISINGAVAALLPVVVVATARAGVIPSHMLIPLAFAASAGSLITLTGTPVNIIVSDLSASSGGRAFGYFEFALVGIPLVVVTTLLVVLLGQRLLPKRAPERLAQAGADPRASVRSWRESYTANLDTERLFTGEMGAVEVLVTPRSTLIGRIVSPGMTTQQEDLVIVAVHRGGAADAAPDDPVLPGTLTLQAGDSVLVHGPWDALHRYVQSSDVTAVEPPHLLQRGGAAGARMAALPRCAGRHDRTAGNRAPPTGDSGPPRRGRPGPPWSGDRAPGLPRDFVEHGGLDRGAHPAVLRVCVLRSGGCDRFTGPEFGRQRFPAPGPACDLRSRAHPGPVHLQCGHRARHGADSGDLRRNA